MYVSMRSRMPLCSAPGRLTLASLEDKRHAVPPLVLDVSHHGRKGRAPRLLWHCVVLLVARLAAVKRLFVLANNDVLRLYWCHATENTDLLVTDILGGERDGSLHGEESEDLEKILRCVSRVNV